MQRPRLGVDCACTTYNWHELRMHRTNSPQSCFGLVNEATKDNPPPTPFLSCDAFSPSFFPLISFCSPACLLMHDLPAALSDSIALALALLLTSRSLLKHTYRAQWVRGISGLKMCTKKKKKKNWQNVPRQGIGKRAQVGHQQASQAGTGKRSQAGNWQAYPGRVLASVPGRDCKCSQAGNRRRPQAGDTQVG